MYLLEWLKLGTLTIPSGDDPVSAADLTEFAGLNDLTDLDVQGVGALVEHHTEGELGMTCCAFVHLTNLLCINACRLIAHSMDAVLHSVDNDFGMQIVGNGGDNSVNITGGDHFFPIGIDRNFGINLLGELDLLGIDFADSAKDHTGNLGAIGEHELEMLGYRRSGTQRFTGDEVGITGTLITDTDYTHAYDVDLLCHLGITPCIQLQIFNNLMISQQFFSVNDEFDYYSYYVAFLYHVVYN